MVFQSEKDYQRLDYQLLREGASSYYLNEDILAEDISRLRADRYRIEAFDCASWHDEPAMHGDLAQKLGFPDHYGKNLDALNDCLRDLEISHAGGRVLVFYKFDVFYENFPHLAWHLLDIIEKRSRSYLLTGQRLLALLQTTDRLGGLAVYGGTHPARSPRESRMRAARIFRD